MSRILVLDDEPDVRLALAATLEDAGHEVFEGGDGRAAHRLALAHKVDLILLDIRMPLMDGFDALSVLKADPRTACIPVVIVSAQSDPDDVKRAQAMGAADFITKPWTADNLSRRVETALRMSHRPA